MSIFYSKSSHNKDAINALNAVLPEMLPKHKIAFIEFATGSSSHFSNNLTDSLDNNTSQNNNRNWLSRIIGLPAYHWVLLSQLIVILPHFAHMPMWLMAYSIFSILMQLPRIKEKFAKRTKLKNWYRFIQMTAFLFGLGGLWISFGGFNVEAGVAFLLLCLVSKLWELYQRRDAFVVLNLSLFVCASLFLLDQGLISSIQALTATLSVLMAFVAMNDDIVVASTNESHQPSGAGRMRSVGMLAGFALPLLVVLFLFFPRLPPLWSLQLSSGQATTGVSDSMSPGDFANLSQSTELAFRVEFAGERPILPDMYWRGLVFSDFDGTTWTANREGFPPWIEGQTKPSWLMQAEQTSNQPEQNYQVILEPTNQRWLFALDYPFSLQEQMGITQEFTLGTYEPVIHQKRYQSSYKPNMKIGLPLTDHQRETNLHLPDIGNEQARQLAKTLYNQVGSPEAYIREISQWINQGEFRYTLSPPALGENRVDEFLFATQAGFCEHYSSSFTYLMRAAGIPARVVVGYQGGQLGRDGSSWEIRQMDAHAWTEVWLKGHGWTRVDPTSWVAPERVEQGMDALSNAQGASLFGDGAFAELSYQQFKMLQEIRRLSDQMSYYWDRDIVGFDNDKQSQSLLKWFNIESLYQQVMVMFTAFAVLIGLISLWLWWKRREQWHIADRELMKLSKRLAKDDETLTKNNDEGMLAWLERMQDASAIEIEQFNQINSSYRKLRYGRLSETDINEKGKTTSEYDKELKELNEAIQDISNKQ